jgi:hypothetical protein
MTTTAANTAAAQRMRILERLHRKPLTTLEARAELDVMHPAARVMELRRKGHEIDTHTTRQYTECGKPHRVALYILKPTNDQTPDKENT